MVAVVNGLRICGPTSRTPSEALQKLKAKIEGLSKPTKDQETTLSTFLLSELRGPLKTELAPKTYSLYEMIARTRIAPHPIGRKLISELTHDDLLAWYLWIQAEMTARSAIRYFSFLKTVLKRAKARGKLHEEIWAGIADPQTEEVVKRILTPLEMKQLLSLIEHPRLKRGVILCAHGFRPAEACGLKSEDLISGCFFPVRQVQDVRGRTFIRNKVKSWRGFRQVPLHPDFLPLFEGIKGWILPARGERPYSPEEFRRDFREAIAETEFQGMCLYDLRSSFGTALLTSGVDIRTSAEIMGHDPSILVKIYARTRPELLRQATNSVWKTEETHTIIHTEEKRAGGF